MKKTSILFLCLLLAGCSIFKKSTTQEDSQTHKVEQRDVLSNVAEDIDITIPPKLFAKLYGLELPEDSARKDSVEADSEPVTVSINRTSETKDETTVTTNKDEQKQVEETVEKETSDLISNFKLFVFIGGIVVIAVSIVVIKKYF